MIIPHHTNDPIRGRPIPDPLADRGLIAPEPKYPHRRLVQNDIGLRLYFVGYKVPSRRHGKPIVRDEFIVDPKIPAGLLGIRVHSTVHRRTAHLQPRRRSGSGHGHDTGMTFEVMDERRDQSGLSTILVNGLM